MKRRLLFLFAVFMIATSVGWGQGTPKELTVDGSRSEEDTNVAFKTLEAAVEVANAFNNDDIITIKVKAGAYDLKRGTTSYESQSGWYLPITKNHLTIIGEGEVTITSTTSSTNGSWASQNLVTIFGDKVTLENLSFVCKTETNKVIEVVGNDVTLRNIKCTPPDGKDFAGSIYFNSPSSDSGKDLGSAILENVQLTKGRLTFTGVERGNVQMNNVTIDYNGVKIEGTGFPDLQQYSPIGSIEGKDELIFTNTNVLVNMGAEAECYHLDAGTVNNLPADATLSLSNGEYSFTNAVTLMRSITVQGAGQNGTIINGHFYVNSPASGFVTLTASDLTLKGSKNNSAHGLIGMIGSGKDSVNLTNCKLDGGALTGQTAAVGVRMESIGAVLSMVDTDIDVAYYGIGLRNKEQVVNLQGGTLTAWGAIMTSAGSLSPNDGSMGDMRTKITAKDATFISRTYQTGISNSYGAVIFQEKYNGVTADFSNCILKAVDGLNPEKHAQQATATDIRSYGNKITFTDCTLSSLEGTNNLPDGSGGYLHAGVIRLGWDGTNDNSALMDNMITITNSELNGKEGESLVYSNRKKEAKAFDKLTINGVIYDPASGLICYGEPDIQNKIDNAIAGETISVPAGEHAGFNVTTADIRIKGVYGKTIIKGAKKYTGSSVACVSADKVALMNLSFKSSADESNRPTGLFVGGGTIEIDSCIFNDKLLQTGLYSEPGNTLNGATLLVQNSIFNVYDKNLLISAGRLNATVKNNVFTDSDISVAKNDGSNVVESNEFHNCIVKVEDGVTFQYNKMFPGDQTYVYSIRPNNFEGTVDASNNYWGSDNPDFSALIDKSRAEKGSVDYFPYYSDLALGALIYKMVTISEDTVWATPHPNQKVTVLDGATLTLSTPMSLDTVTMREGAQIKSNIGDKTGSVTTKSLCFSPDLSGDKWKDLGMPFASGVIKNSKGEPVATPSLKDANEGIWFANLKDSKTPEFTVDETAFGMAGLWAANGDSYTISSKETFEFKTLEEPTAPTETGTFLMCSNPNTFTITLKQSAYILTADGQSFEQEANPEIKPFQSFVLTDAKTLGTLRSLRIGEGVVTGNQTVEPVDGYYVSTERGAIVIHTAEAVDVMIIGMNGKVAYRGEATDGQRIELPSGIYAVNGQLVRVK